MPYVTIQHSRIEHIGQANEKLILDATVQGRQKIIEVNIGRYEKRPVFSIKNFAELGDYTAKNMRDVLNAVVLAHAKLISDFEELTN